MPASLIVQNINKIMLFLLWRAIQKNTSSYQTAVGMIYIEYFGKIQKEGHQVESLVRNNFHCSNKSLSERKNFEFKGCFDKRKLFSSVARWPFFGPFLANVAIFESHFLEKNNLAISWILAILWLFLAIFATFSKFSSIFFSNMVT